MDRFHLMTVFVAVAEAEGFAVAARRLRMSPPAVTRADRRTRLDRCRPDARNVARRLGPDVPAHRSLPTPMAQCNGTSLARHHHSARSGAAAALIGTRDGIRTQTLHCE